MKKTPSFNIKLWVWVVSIVAVLIIAYTFILYFMRPSADAGDIMPPTYTITSDATILNSRYTSGPNTYDFTNTDLILDGPITVLMARVNNFKSLTINNGATVTQKVLTKTLDFNETTFELTDLGDAKRVEIHTTGDLTINNGKINVDGKGYPGGSFNCNDCCGGNTPASGPGAGLYASAGNSARAAGAGYYTPGGGARTLADGIGQQWQDVPNSAGKAYYTDGSFLPGSGGGSASSDCQSRGYGGAGAGRIKLVVNGKITMKPGTSISANGSNGTGSDADGGHSRGGGGSGGMIWIQTNSINYDTSGGGTFNAATVNGSVVDGGNGMVFNRLGGSLFSLFANGGLGGYSQGGGGAGGVILVEEVDTSSPSPSPSPSITIKIGDLNSDGVVDISDFAILVGNWGPVNSATNVGDLNSDNVIDISDFAVLVGNWG